MKQRVESVTWKTRPDQRSRKKKRFLKNEGTLRAFWENMKYNNIHIMKVPEEERERTRDQEPT